MIVETKLLESTAQISTHSKYAEHIGAEFEPDFISMLAKLVKPQDIALDIGANVGVTAVALSRLASKVYAFEPNPEAFSHLEETIRLNRIQNIKAENLGCSNRNQDCIIVYHDDSSGGTVITNPGIDVNSIGFPNKKEMTFVVLDDYLGKNKIMEVNFMKIDVEGHELEVLAGLRSTIKNNGLTAVLEANNWCLNVFNNTTIVDYIKQIEEFFSCLYAFDGKVVLDLQDEKQKYHFFHQNLIFQRFQNLVCFSDERLRERFLEECKDDFSLYQDTKPVYNVLQLIAERNQANAERNQANTERNQAIAERDLAIAQVQTFLDSNSWKYTAPLRKIRSIF